MTLKLRMGICVLFALAVPAAQAKETLNSRSDLKDRQEEVARDIKKIRAAMEKISCDDSVDGEAKDSLDKECRALTAKLEKSQDELLDLRDKLASQEGHVCLECEAARTGGMSNTQSNTASLLNSMAQMLSAMRMEIAALKYQGGMSQQMNAGANTMYGQSSGMNMNMGTQSMMMPANYGGGGVGSSSALNYFSSMMSPNIASNYGYGNSSYLRPPAPRNFSGYNNGTSYGSYYGSQGTTATSVMIPAR